MNPSVIIKDLTKMFVVFKRVKKENWYYRGRVVTSRSARRASLFGTKEEAEAKVKELNVGRKAYRFKTETADKHFVNSWKVKVDGYNGGVSIFNEYLALGDVIKRKYTVNNSLNNQKPAIVNDLDKRLQNTAQEITNAEEYCKRQIAQAQANLEQSKHAIAQKAAALLNTKNFITGTDFDKEYIEKYQTPLDKKTLILFGAKDVNTSSGT